MAVGSLGWEPLWQRAGDASSAILWDIRLPRTLGAWLAGALLGLAGAVAQGLFRNPLADPYLLGSATGAALGVAVLLVLIGISPMAASGWAARLGLTGAGFAGAVVGGAGHAGAGQRRAAHAAAAAGGRDRRHGVRRACRRW